MKTEFSNTFVKKGFHGWQAKTVVSIENGSDFEISTLKRSSGFVSCSAQLGTHKDLSNGMSSFRYLMFTDPLYRLAEKKTRATEKSISQIHEAGLIIFKQKLEAGELVTKAAKTDD